MAAMTATLAISNSIGGSNSSGKLAQRAVSHMAAKNSAK